MKVQTVFSMSLVLFVSLLLSFPSLARAEREGGNTSGGGDTELSTEMEVLFQAAGAAQNVFSLLDGSHQFEDSRARDSVNVIRKRVDLSRLKNGAAYEAIQGPCFDQNSQIHAGSAVIGRTEEPFCLSLSEVRKLPPESLPDQLTGLMVHELAHQAGFGEETAVALQKAVLKWQHDFRASAVVRLNITRAQFALYQVRQILEKRDTGDVCAKFVEVDGALDELRDRSDFDLSLLGSAIQNGFLSDRTSSIDLTRFAPFCKNAMINEQGAKIVLPWMEMYLNRLMNRLPRAY